MTKPVLELVIVFVRAGYDSCNTRHYTPSSSSFPRHVGGGLGLLFFDRFFDLVAARREVENPAPASSSGICSTDRSVRSIARLRTPVCSIVRLALWSWRLTFSKTPPNLSNSVRTAPRMRHTLRGALLDGQGLEAHAQAGENRG